MFRPHIAAAGVVSGLLVFAGCAGIGYRIAARRAGDALPSALVQAAAQGEIPAAVETGPEIEQRPMPSPWRTGLVGAEFGTYAFRDDDFDAWFDSAVYGGIKLAWEPGLNWGMSVSAGFYRAKSRTEGGDDIEVFPVRATFELGGLMFFTQSRWFVGAGPGFAFVPEAIPSEDKVDLWPVLHARVDNEWSVHVVGGFEFRNESPVALRLEGGHAWLVESAADVWMMAGTLSYQF